MELLFISLDEEYVGIIEGALVTGLSRRMKISVISDIRFLTEYSNSEHKVSILIIDEKCLGYAEKIKADKTFVITEKNDASDTTIYKYGGAQAVMRAIPLEFIRNDGSKLKETKIIKVLSPCGGSGKTTTAVGVSRALFEMGRKVLYINTENIQNFSFVIQEEKRLSEDIIRLLTRSVSVSCDYLLSSLENKGFDYVPQIDGLLSSWQISLDVLLDIAYGIRDKNIYDYIVVEMPKEIMPKESFMVHENENVIVTVLQDEYSCLKTKSLISNMGYKSSNCVLVCNKYDENENKAFEQEIENCPVCEYIKTDKTKQFTDCFVRTATAVS